jgi:hypothetical protein
MLHSLEKDLLSCQWINDKVMKHEYYRQNLYAALCSNRFQKNDTWPILIDEFWTCSWRYAGEIISNMYGKGSYMDYYCSGVMGEEIALYDPYGYVSEGTVTEEIRQDLLSLGWTIEPYEKKHLI